MTELEKTVEALKLCVGPKALEKALATLSKKYDTEAAAEPVHHDVKSMECCISDLLLDVGMPTHIKGYRFSITAIRLLIEEPEMADGFTKWLYPKIAKIHDSTDSRVERAIRHGIEVAFDRMEPDTFYSYFRNAVSSDKGKATNSEFLTRMADVAKRKLGV